MILFYVRYAGILQKGGFDIAYEGCNKLSRMKGNRLLRGRGQGVSFDVMDSEVGIFSDFSKLVAAKAVYSYFSCRSL